LPVSQATIEGESEGEREGESFPTNRGDCGTLTTTTRERGRIMKCDYCKEENWKEMCDCCAEADEAGVLEEYLAGTAECPACIREGASNA
jgi:hypothetical protein